MAEAAPETLGPRGLIDRTEYIRVLEQALRALGYEGVAAQLEAASGVVQQPPQAAAFRQAVLSGRYDDALRLLPSVAADEAVLERARFLLLRQKYLEGVQRGRTAEALQVLRQELQPLRVQQQVLHSLAALLLRSPGTEGRGSDVTNGTHTLDAVTEGRAALLDELQDSLVPSLLIPERRLEELLEQALVSQLDRSRYHNCLHPHLSLFSDYQAGADQLPTQSGQVLEEHSSEVWCLAFSADGRWAASASKDGTAVLWSVTGGAAPQLTAPRLLVRQSQPCQLVCFSPDSRLVLTAALDGVVRLHDAASARQLREFPQGRGQGDAVVALSWFPAGSGRFLVASHKQLAVFDVDQAGAAPLQRLPPPHAFVYDAAVGPGGTCVITVGQDKHIAFTRLADGRVASVAESSAVTSMQLSPCGRFLATSLVDSCVHVWQLPPGLGDAHHADAGLPSVGLDCGQQYSAGRRQRGGRPLDPLDALPAAPLHELRMGDARPSRFVVRCCVGGATSGFVACGGEDCRLYIWSRVTGELLACLSGPAGCVNCVAWHPRNPHLIACACDDGTIRTWVAPALLASSIAKT